MSAAVAKKTPHHSDMTIPMQLRSALSHWIETGKPGSFFLTTDDKLYVMTYFDHREISDKAIKLALVQRERLILAKTKRSQKVIRWLFSALLVSALVYSSTLAAYFVL